MKKSIKSSLVLLISIVLVSASLPAKKNNLQGVWRMVSGKINGIENPPITTDRTWEFKKDNTFEGKIFLPDAVRTYNEGVYALPNDTTMLTVHTRNGKMDPFPFKYNYTIKNDTLRLYGYYLAASKTSKGMLQPMHIDELWVKVKLK